MVVVSFILKTLVLLWRLRLLVVLFILSSINHILSTFFSDACFVVIADSKIGGIAQVGNGLSTK